MRQRLISAAVLVPVVVIVFLLGQPWIALGIAVLGAFAAYEAAQLVKAAGLPANTWIAVATPLLGVLAFDSVIRPGGELAVTGYLIAPAIAVWFIVSALPGLLQREPHNGFLAWVGTAFAGLYPTMLAFVVGLYWLTAFSTSEPLWGGVLDTGRIWLLILVATVWAFDSAAYIAGRTLGRHPFMQHISPSKTWEGVIGGTLAAMLVCAGLLWSIGQHAIGGAALGLAIAVAAQAGDLAESMLKRAAGAKDSGNLIPGHGGVLDRVDSFLFAAPVTYGGLVLVAVLHLGGILD